MCKECFSRFERDTGEMVRLEKEAMRDSDPFVFGGEHDEPPTDPLADTITEVSKKP